MKSPSRSKHDFLLPFILVTSLFFLWGFVHNLDPILIPHLKKSFSLSTLQSSLVDSAVFIAYFLIALPAGFIMKKYGYKAGIITGIFPGYPAFKLKFFTCCHFQVFFVNLSGSVTYSNILTTRTIFPSPFTPSKTTCSFLLKSLL